MIRLVQHKLILPRGDTGSLTIPALPNFNTGDVAVFAIFNPLNKTIIFKKQVEIVNQKITIYFSHNETVNLPVGSYFWDIKAYVNPEYADGELVNGDQIDSYYAGYKLPECQIRQTSDNYLLADDAPTATLSSAQLDIISAALAQLRDAVQKTQENVSHYPVIIDEEWYTWDNNTNQYVGTGVRVPARISDLIDDSGHYTKPANGIPADDIANGVIPDISVKTDKVLNAISGNFASLDAQGNLIDSGHKHSDYLTEHQDISGKQNVLTFDDSPQMISNNPVKSSGIWNAINTAKTDLQGNLNILQGQVNLYAQDIMNLKVNKQNKLTFDSAPTANSTNPVTSGGVYEAITNIKTMGIHICTSQEYNSQTGVPTIASPDTKTFYLVPGGEGSNLYIEWIYINNAWEQFGSATIDLSGYALKTEIPSNISSFTNDVGYLTQHQDISGKQDTLTFDNAPQQNSTNPVTSNGIRTAINNIVKIQNTQPTQPDVKIWVRKDDVQTVEIPTVNDVETMINNAGFIISYTETDPTVPAWAKSVNKPTYTASEIGLGNVANERQYSANNPPPSDNTKQNKITASGLLKGDGNGNITTAVAGTDYIINHQDISGKQDTLIFDEVPTTGSNNPVMSKGIKSAIDAVSNSIPSVTGKADKVSGATAENLAALDANGNLTDSGKKVSDFLTTHQTIPVTDVQVNGTSVLNNGVANVPIASTSSPGVIRVGAGLTINSSNDLLVDYAIASENKAGTNYRKPVTPYTQHAAAFYGLAKAAGDTTQSASDNAIGTYTDSAKTAIKSMLGVNVDDVQINGTSIVSNGVADIPYGTDSRLGVVRTNASLGIGYNTGGIIRIVSASSAEIKQQASQYKAITPIRQHESVFYGLAKAAGDTTQADSDNAVGTYTETAQSKIHEMLDAPVTVSGTDPVITGKAGIRYICGECDTLTFTPPASGIVDVIFTSGTTPTVLSVPNTVKWPGWFDPTSLDASTTYELNIMDGVYGAVMAWT